MSKVKCAVCANEISGICSIKKIGVKINKPRICEAYIYAESKMKAKQDVPTIRVGYEEQQEAKRRYKEELKALKALAKQEVENKTAKSLGLMENDKFMSAGDDPKLLIPRTNMKHPLTGDLSRFTTTVNKDKV
jgi:hypothetical protein